MGDKEINEKDILDSIPRHPNDEMVAYGRDLDPDVVVPLIRKRLLLGAVFQDYTKPPEDIIPSTLDLAMDFRQACAHFTGFFASHERGHHTDMDHGIAVMRGIGNSSGFGIDDAKNYQGNKSLLDFLKNEWLIKQIIKVGNYTKEGLGEYGYGIFQAPAGQTPDGFLSNWHTHNDITSHFTIHGAGLQTLPSYVDPTDAQNNPDKYEHLTLNANPNDLLIMGRLIHRSSHDIPEKGQFAFITHGPYYSND